MHATPHDNTVAVAAFAGAVPATHAGSVDCAVLGTANTTWWPSQLQCSRGQVFLGGRWPRRVAVSVVAYAAAVQQYQRAGPTAAAPAR